MIKFFRKRSVWLPTWSTILIAVTAFGLLAWFLAANLHSYLSLTDPAEDAKILVVEGWIADHVLEKFVREENIGERYDLICTTGVKLDRGHYLIEFDNYAELSARTIEKLGIPPSKIIAAPSGGVVRDRTYHSAVGFKNKRAASDNEILRGAKSIDVLTSGVHGRRSRTVFQKVLGDHVDVGVISVDDGSYDHDKWFTSSAGVKAVITASISLGYEWIGKKDR